MNFPIDTNCDVALPDKKVAYANHNSAVIVYFLARTITR